ncbi:DUF4405 domain-containing protein [uncultured Methanoregula sp.]|uniref:DUF4405 domain-containing protein n=1 Tax=uncultured Methanoregula sp. TaxID=1005933 RepID=UPI002AAACDA1|nr:DUF4405 domain-containing protein [uncultured Methanoregula sp.]
MKNQQIVRWCVDVALGITFLVSLITGLTKLTVVLRMTGMGQVILPLARISDIHDTAGVLLGLLVFIHLFLNRRWLLVTTKQILAGNVNEG